MERKDIYVRLDSSQMCVFTVWRSLHLSRSLCVCRSMQCLINFLNVLLSELDGQRISGYGTANTKFGRQRSDMSTEIEARCNNFRSIQLVLMLLCLERKMFAFLLCDLSCETFIPHSGHKVSHNAKLKVVYIIVGHYPKANLHHALRRHKKGHF